MTLMKLIQICETKNIIVLLINVFFLLCSYSSGKRIRSGCRDEGWLHAVARGLPLRVRRDGQVLAGARGQSRRPERVGVHAPPSGRPTGSHPDREHAVGEQRVPQHPLHREFN